MNEPGPVTSDDRALTRPVFVSYASADRKRALAVCKALERRGASCWISCRDVQAGENYQESIVRALRTSRAMVLVFSEAANNSDEIKKELSLASRYHVPLLAVRIDDVEPSDAFAYELSTRQWIDAFENWDRSIDMLVGRIDRIGNPEGSDAAPVAQTAHRRAHSRTPSKLSLAIGIGALAIAAVAVLLIWKPFAAREPLTVQISAFQALGSVPADTPAAFQQALAGAFGDDNAVVVKDKNATYALSGSVRNVGNSLQYAVRLTDTRTGAMLWSASPEVDDSAGDTSPAQAAAQISWVVRCGLADAMGYAGRLPPRTLSLYLQHCELYYWDGTPTRSLDVIKKVVQQAPDFSKGWSMMAMDSALVARTASGAAKARLIASGKAAVTRALELDPRNANAYLAASLLVPSADWARREYFHRRSVEVRESDCGCEHQSYALFLLYIGRPSDAIVQAQRAADMEATVPAASDLLAVANYQVGNVAEADRIVAERAALWKGSSNNLLWLQALETKRWADAAAAAKKEFTDPGETQLADAFTALASKSPERIAAARAAVLAMPADDATARGRAVFLTAVGDNADALAVLEPLTSRPSPNTEVLLDAELAPLRSDPRWVALLTKVGLIDYWRTSHKPPELCKAATPPTFCRTM